MTGDKDRAAASAADENNAASSQAARIRQLNDAFRTSLHGGMVMMTDGVASLGGERVARLLSQVRAFNSFAPANDPYGEHDFGSFEDEGERFFWKIEYYDPSLSFGSPDPADPAMTQRVLTLMVASEY